MALLAKQGWWLMTITHSLVFRVLKSKYFPFGTFLDAKLGSNPFFLWRSILAGRPTLMVGLFWRVGNGSVYSGGGRCLASNAGRS